MRLLLPLLIALSATAGENPAKELDHSGMAWKRPFPVALDAAKAGDRLLLIKPIAFGTGANGCW